MKCIDTGTLQAFIDFELEIALRKEVEQHLAGCEDCTKKLMELKSNDDFVYARMKEVTDAAAINGASAKGVMSFMIKYRKIAAVACSVVLITACMTVQPVRAAIANALSVFRVENVKGLKISLDDIREIQSKLSENEAEIDMKKMGKINTTGGEKKQITLDEAKKLSDMSIAAPSTLSGVNPEVKTIEASAMEFTLDTSHVNEALKLFGGTKLLPEEIDKKTFRINFSRSIEMNYNLEAGKFLKVTQTKAPSIEVPEGVDVDELYSSLVELPLLPSNLQNQLKSIKDWKSTLYVPMVESETSEVDINGSTAYLYSGNDNNSNKTHSALIWFKDGVVFAASGNMSSDELLTHVRAMR